ncbi:MAG: tetratricopeptide repeat protein [Bacteroidota bacterium]
MSIIKKIFRRTGMSDHKHPQNNNVEFIVMQGNEFTELSTFDTIPGICATCGKDAEVITADIADVRKLATGSVHYPAKLGTKGWKQIPDKSSKLAAYCESCQGYFHLHCVEPLTLGGGTLFRCPNCIRELGPAPKSMKEVIFRDKSAQDYTKEGIEYQKSGKQEEAIKAFQQALGIDPNDAWARWQLGAMYKTQDRLDEAIREFEEVLRRGAGSMRESTEYWLNEARILKTERDKPQSEIESQIGSYMEQLGEHSERWFVAYDALKRIGAPAVDAALHVIQSSNSSLRLRALELLAIIGNQKALGPLQKASKISKEDFSKISDKPLNSSDFKDYWREYQHYAQEAINEIKARSVK